jgi:chorismate-pyruvate lyase
VEFGSAREALAELCEPFAARGWTPDCDEIQPARMPAPQRRLLAHREHMTIVLGEHHGRPVDVRVQHAVHDGDFYTRKILLTPGGSDRIVEAGIVRLNFSHVPADVRTEILARRRPLGEILTAHDVLRRIEPLWFVRFAPDSDVLALFDLHLREPAYGRLAMIYCNDEPAIELMEIVINV